MEVPIQAQDWPNLGKYHKANTNLKAPAADQQRIVFMGDSITEFWSTIDSEYFLGKPYINRGISGQTTPQMLLRFKADVIALRPYAVLILAGVNDIAGNTGPTTLEMIEKNIISMVELARSNQILVVLCSVLPAVDFPWKPNQNPTGKILALNQLLKKYAIANGITYVDYFSVMSDQGNGLKWEYSSDGVHPNKAGYRIMAPLAEKAIAQILEINH